MHCCSLLSSYSFCTVVVFLFLEKGVGGLGLAAPRELGGFQCADGVVTVVRMEEEEEVVVVKATVTTRIEGLAV